MISERGWACFQHDELAASVVVDYLLRNDCPVQIAGRTGTGPDSGVRVRVPVSCSIEPSGTVVTPREANMETSHGRL